jgi:hypothetical protein
MTFCELRLISLYTYTYYSTCISNGYKHKQDNFAKPELMTFWLAATWALRSDKLSWRFLDPAQPGILAGAMSSSTRASSRKTPFTTSLKLLNVAPSSLSILEWGGIEPGVIPPMSAWCPRLATKKIGDVSPLQINSTRSWALLDISI